MSAGATDGYDLTVETLTFLNDNWSAAASSIGETWDVPVLRNHVDKTIFTSNDETATYTAQLRNNDVITVGKASRTDSPVGTEFDFDVTKELDVKVEAMPGNGFSVIGDSTDWERFVLISREAILIDRHNPITDPGSRYDWRWITITNENPLPETVGNRNRLGVEYTTVWHGYENLSNI